MRDNTTRYQQRGHASQRDRVASVTRRAERDLGRVVADWIDPEDVALCARTRRDERAYEARGAREDRAEALIGELMRDGRTVHYVYPAGGTYREGSRVDLLAYLLRRGYA